jgi:hypothetical protein
MNVVGEVSGRNAQETVEGTAAEVEDDLTLGVYRALKYEAGDIICDGLQSTLNLLEFRVHALSV